jgi:hypothetical protein
MHVIENDDDEARSAQGGATDRPRSGDGKLRRRDRLGLIDEPDPNEHHRMADP